MNARDALNAAMLCGPGEGLKVDWPTREEAKAFLRRLSATVAHSSRATRSSLEASDPNWGKNPWEGIIYRLVDDRSVFIGRPADPLSSTWVAEEGNNLKPIDQPKLLREDQDDQSQGE